MKKNDVTEVESDVFEADSEVENKKLGVASTEKIQRANELLASLFNIDSTFYMTGAKDGGTNLTLEFANMDFEVKIKIKDVYEMGIMTEEE